jgi:hypothetical protein
MVNIAALFTVGFIIVLGIVSVFAITAHGEISGTAQTDTFGDTPSATSMAVNNGTADLAVQSSSMMGYIAFLLIVCVVVISASVWLWNQRRTGKKSGY